MSDTIKQLNIELIKTSGKKKPGKYLKTKLPKRIELAYYQDLKKNLVRKMLLYVNKYIVPRYQDYLTQYNNEMRIDSYGNTIQSDVQAVATMISSESLEAISRKYPYQVNIFNETEFRKNSKSVVGVELYKSEPWLRQLSQSWISQNVELIKSIEDQFFSQIGIVVQNAVESGESTAKLAERIEKIGSVSEKRAMVIARDQIGKLNGKISRNRAQSTGMEYFIWRTAGDEAVRDSHRELEGKRFSWKKGANGLFPGQEIQCRCVGVSDFSEFF